MKVVKHNYANNVVFKHFRCCGPIEADGGIFTYAIPKTIFAEWILKKRGYLKIYSMMLGFIFRKPITQINIPPGDK